MRNHLSRVLSLCCVLAFAAPVALMQAPASLADSGCPTPAPFVDGNGQSAGTAYEIASAANLQYLRENPAIWDDNLYFSLHADIDMTGCTWTGGIGQTALNGNGFKGYLDGNGFVISGMTITSSVPASTGFIATQTTGNVEDLGVRGSITITASAQGSAYIQVGGLIGASYSTGTVQRSFADVDIVVTAATTESCGFFCQSSVSVYAGGLLGDSTTVNISDSYAMGDVSATASPAGASGGSTLFVGGLIGGLYYKTVTNSYSTGIPNAVAALGPSNMRVGGFAGFGGGNAGVFMTTPGSVWDTQTSGTATGVGLAQGSPTPLPTGKTTAEMKSISTYPTWNISSTYDATKTWIVCPTINNGYPAFMLSQPVGTCSPPDVSAVTPASGTTAGGTSVTISGTNLANATSVTIGGTAATVTANTATSITATTPAGTAGAADIVVTNGNGSDTLVGGFTYAAPQSDTYIGQSGSSSSGQPTTTTVVTSPIATLSTQDQYPEIVPTPPVSAPDPSSATAVVDGIPTGSTVTQAGTTTTVTTPGTGTTFAVTAPSIAGTLPAGSPTRFTFTGGRPGTPVSIYVMSDPVLVANAVTDAAGAVSGFVTLPVSIVPGQHTLVVSGYANSGAAVSSYLGIKVSAPARTRRAHVLFDLGSYRLSPSARKTLDALVVRARGTAPATVTVGAVRASGATADDRRLALRRARVVAAYLRDEGMPGTVRVGASLPTRMTNAQARRVDVTVTFR